MTASAGASFGTRPAGRKSKPATPPPRNRKSAALDRARHMLRMGFVVYEIREPSGALFLDEAAIQRADRRDCAGRLIEAGSSFARIGAATRRTGAGSCRLLPGPDGARSKLRQPLAYPAPSPSSDECREWRPRRRIYRHPAESRDKPPPNEDESRGIGLSAAIDGTSHAQERGYSLITQSSVAQLRRGRGAIAA